MASQVIVVDHFHFPLQNRYLHSRCHNCVHPSHGNDQQLDWMQQSHMKDRQVEWKAHQSKLWIQLLAILARLGYTGCIVWQYYTEAWYSIGIRVVSRSRESLLLREKTPIETILAPKLLWKFRRDFFRDEAGHLSVWTFLFHVMIIHYFRIKLTMWDI